MYAQQELLAPPAKPTSTSTPTEQQKPVSPLVLETHSLKAAFALPIAATASTKTSLPLPASLASLDALAAHLL